MSYYRSGDTVVDDDFVRFGSKSYAIDKLTSIDTKNTLLKKAGPRWAYMLVALGALFAFIAWPVGLFLLLVGAFRWYKTKDRPERRRYDLMFVTGGGETMAYQTESGSEIAQLRGAIETSMTAHRRRERETAAA